MFGRKNIKSKLTKRQKIMVFIAVFVAVLLSAIIVGYVIFANRLQTILPGNPIDAITKNAPLETSDGRTNFLLFGTSYDDPNPNHTGGYLTDSLVVLSVNRQTKKVYTISVPRDLWVDYGMSCSTGKSGKINAIYACTMKNYGSSDTVKASKALTDTVSSVVGLEINYYLKVNYTAIQSLTDAVGGIDVEAYSHDARGIYDRNVGLRLPTGVNHLDGKTALKLARARNAAGGYGLPRSNFDREINQQRIIAAILGKLSDNGTLTNPNKALKLVNALSGEVQTDIQTSELRSATSTARNIDTSKIVSIPLTDYLTTANLQGQSIVQPVTGLNNYTDVQHYIMQSLAGQSTP